MSSATPLVFDMILPLLLKKIMHFRNSFCKTQLTFWWPQDIVNAIGQSVIIITNPTQSPRGSGSRSLETRTYTKLMRGFKAFLSWMKAIYALGYFLFCFYRMLHSNKNQRRLICIILIWGFSYNVTKIQTRKLLILLRFYFHDV